MKYELAKQLKESGFPQKPKGFCVFWDVKYERFGYLNAGEETRINEEYYIKFPSLSELIEACGDGFLSLSRHANIWQTNFVNGMGGETAGTTPEEAVANLWLALHEK